MIDSTNYVGTTLKTLKPSKAKGISITVIPDTADPTLLEWLLKFRMKRNPVLPFLVPQAMIGGDRNPHLLAIVVDPGTGEVEQSRVPDHITGSERDHCLRVRGPSGDASDLEAQETENYAQIT